LSILFTLSLSGTNRILAHPLVSCNCSSKTFISPTLTIARCPSSSCFGVLRAAYDALIDHALAVGSTTNSNFCHPIFRLCILLLLTLLGGSQHFLKLLLKLCSRHHNAVLALRAFDADIHAHTNDLHLIVSAWMLL